MKFFHLSDLHIGLKLMQRDLQEDQRYILEQIVTLAKEQQPDAIVIAGDVYDKAVPSAEAVSLFDTFIENLTKAVPESVLMVISGNHDSGPRLDCFRGILSRQNIHMVGIPPQTQEERMEKVVLYDTYGAVTFYLLPFVKPSMVKQIVGLDEKGNTRSYEQSVGALLKREEIDTSQRNVFVSHQFYLPGNKEAEDVERMDSEMRMVGNIDQISSEVLKSFDYAALGHIHKPMKVGKDCYRYCGTPIACSVSEAGQKKGVIVVEMQEKGKVETKVLPLQPLRQVKIVRGTLEEVLQQACEDYVTVILTDKAEGNMVERQERIHMAFPYLLELRREQKRQANYARMNMAQERLNPLALCKSFLKTVDEKEEKLLEDVIRTVQERGENA